MEENLEFKEHSYAYMFNSYEMELYSAVHRQAYIRILVARYTDSPIYAAWCTDSPILAAHCTDCPVLSAWCTACPG